MTTEITLDLTDPKANDLVTAIEHVDSALDLVDRISNAHQSLRDARWALNERLGELIMSSVRSQRS